MRDNNKKMIYKIQTTRPTTVCNTMNNNFIKFVLISTFLAILMVIQLTKVDGFIKFGYILNTTACDTCDELRTYSGRNVFCCLAQSKCCGPNSLDELDALTTTQVPSS